MEKSMTWTARPGLSRREFLSAGASSAMLLSGAAGPVQTEEVPEATDKVLLFGSVPQKYLKDWEITSDFELVARKLDSRGKCALRLDARDPRRYNRQSGSVPPTRADPQTAASGAPHHLGIAVLIEVFRQAGVFAQIVALSVDGRHGGILHDAG